MKLLVVCSTLDLSYKLGCTPSWWQLLKALHETGNEVIAVPFLGDSVESLWWRCYPNPCTTESKVFNSYLEWKKNHGSPAMSGKRNPTFLNRFSENYIRSRWENFLVSVLNREQDIDALFLMNVPFNYIRGIPEKIKAAYGIPVAFYEGDMPIALPGFVSQSGYKFSYYSDADLSVFDAFFTNSRGVIPDLKEMGAKNVHPLYYAADPELFKPLDTGKEIDVSFYGYGTALREEWMKKMITEPSRRLSDRIFSVGGKGFGMDLGRARMAGDLSYSAFRRFCCQSKICLNITRTSHASVYASATARLFELAAFGRCMISQPYLGMEEWFEPGKEVMIAKDENEVLSVYQSMLDSEDEREKMGERARARILKDHTYRHRAEMLVQAL
jgi:hypothetical protein